MSVQPSALRVKLVEWAQNSPVQATFASLFSMRFLYAQVIPFAKRNPLSCLVIFNAAQTFLICYHVIKTNQQLEIDKHKMDTFSQKIENIEEDIKKVKTCAQNLKQELNTLSTDTFNRFKKIVQILDNIVTPQIKHTT